MSDNNLCQFPVSVCGISSLVEVNLSTNKIEELPVEIGQLKNLEVLHLHNNRLQYVPDDLMSLTALNYVILAFNKFTNIPQTLLQLSENEGSKMTTVIMSGNDIDKIGNEQINRMKHITRLSLQMNKLTLRPTETVKFNALEHLTFLDVRQNKVRDLDVRCIKTLEQLNCERNSMTSLQLCGTHIKVLRAAHNHISNLVIIPKPEWIEYLDISYNRLSSLPEYLASCCFLKTLLANHNKLKSIPSRLLCDASALQLLSLNHNHLTELPADIPDRSTIEELYLHRNQLSSIPSKLLAKSNKLRILNVSRNNLSHLPPPHEFEDHNKLQELYVSHNRLRDDVMDVIGQYPRLKVLYLAYNKLEEICETSLSRLDGLRELNISGNRLKALPECILQLHHLTVLRAHSNQICHLPNFDQFDSLKILDVGSNQLLDLSVKSLVDSHLNLLDMSLNNNLSLSTDDLLKLKGNKSINFVDITGMNRSLPGTPDVDDHMVLGPGRSIPPWTVGLAETSGTRNRLCITVLKNMELQNKSGHIFAMFDGGLNDEVPTLLHKVMPTTLNEEFDASPATPVLNLKYSIMSSHRDLKTVGQKLGAALTIVHLCKSRGESYNLTVANAGDVEAVLSRNNEVILLTRNFTITEDRDELDRIKSGDGLVTEDNRIYGTSRCTRLIGGSYLHPHVVPEPHVCSLNLGPEDRFIIIANRCLWNFMTYQEVVLEVLQIQHPVLAAKKLQDVAQAYGCKENLGILVIYFNIGKGEDAAWDVSIYDDQFYLQESSDDESVYMESETDPEPNLTRTPEGTMRLKPLGAKRYLKKENAGNWESALQRRLADSIKEKEVMSSMETIKPDRVRRLQNELEGGEWRLSSAETKRRFMRKTQISGMSHLNKMEMNGTAEEIEYPMEFTIHQLNATHKHSHHSSSEESLASTLCDEEGEYKEVDAYLNSLLEDGGNANNDIDGNQVFLGNASLFPRLYETEEQEISIMLDSESEFEFVMDDFDIKM